MDLTATTTTYQQDDQSWLGSAHGTDAGVPITLDTSAFTAGTHYPNGYFLSGLGLGKITATGLYGPYNNAASDGSEVLAGFLLTPVDAPAATTTDVQGVLLRHGRVIQANLPVSLGDSTAIAAAKVDVAGRLEIL